MKTKVTTMAGIEEFDFEEEGRANDWTKNAIVACKLEYREVKARLHEYESDLLDDLKDLDGFKLEKQNMINSARQRLVYIESRFEYLQSLLNK